MWNFLKEKWLTLLLSLVLGWLLWFYTSRLETTEDHLSVPFDVHQPSADLQATVDPELKRVELSFRGPTGSIYRVTGGDRNIRVVYEPVNPEKMIDGKPHNVVLDRSMVQNLPRDLEVMQFIPATISVTIDRLAEKLLPVAAPEYYGKPEPGFTVYKAEVIRPSKVHVSGPETLLNKLNEVKPEAVDVTGMNGDFRDADHQLIKKYTVGDTTGQLIKSSSVEILISIRHEAAHRTITGVQIEIAQAECRPPAKPLDIEIVSPANPIDLELEGPPDTLPQIKAESLRAFIYIDTGNRKPDDSTPFYQPLIVWGLPEDVKLTKAVVVTARIRPKAEPQPATGAPKP